VLIDIDYYECMGAAARLREGERASLISDEMQQFIEHLAELLAEEYAAALKEERDASSSVCAVLEREPARTEH
jgi:hypothetical protein